MRLFLYGANPGFDESACDSVEKKLAMTGNNTGNQLIGHGLVRSLVYAHIDWRIRGGPDYVNANFDMVVIPAANFLFPGFDLGGMASFLDQIKLPLAIIGLGAQSNDYTPKMTLKPGTERLIRIVAERAPRIEVRGPFTALVLAEMGIENVQIVGCPSYYMNGDQPAFPTKKALPERPRLAINGSRDVVVHSFDREKMLLTIYGLMAEAVRYDSVFVAQTEKEEMIFGGMPQFRGGPTGSRSLRRIFRQGRR